ncbi:MAG: tetratricopeptide repeat protein [Terrimicrobiaceae bacterium]
MIHLRYFQDSRFRRDRIRLVVTLILAATLLAGVGLLFLTRGEATTGKGNDRKKIDEAVRHFLEGDLKAARGVLLRVDLEKARSAEGWELAGMLEEAAGKRESALAQYTKGLTIRQSGALYYHRARLLREQGDLASAMTDMDLAAARAPMDILISNERLLLMVQAGLVNQANAEIKKLRENGGSGSSGAWLFGLCGIALQNGEYSEARKILDVVRPSVPSKIFDRMLKDPVLVRHMARPEITAFYLSNLPK